MPGDCGEGIHLMATAAPGGAVYDNIVTHNALSGNGLAGVTVHSHVPAEDLNGNVVTGDHFGIWTTGPVTVQHAKDNAFLNVAVPIATG